jgi:hypothetical protein
MNYSASKIILNYSAILTFETLFFFFFQRIFYIFINIRLYDQLEKYYKNTIDIVLDHDFL